MAFEKGRKKTGGKVKGSKNKATLLLEGRKEDAYALVDKVLSFVKDEMQSSDRDRQLKAIDKLSPILPFIIPKQASVDANVDLKSNLTEFILPVGYED
jgi:hypothetical protein